MTLGPAAFAGVWQLQRQITDHLGQQSGQFEGRATLTDAGAGRLDYHETGTFQLHSGARLQAERRYLWVFDEDGVQMLFDDGRAFHDFVPTGQSDDIRHLCGADTYDVRYDFGGWPVWTARWTVTGPRKDYVSFARYNRD